MLTRSQLKRQLEYEKKVLYDVKIDFDEASEAWKSNKIYIGNGSYRYLCQKTGQYKNRCHRKCLEGEDYCEIHYKMMLKKLKTNNEN